MPAQKVDEQIRISVDGGSRRGIVWKEASKSWSAATDDNGKWMSVEGCLNWRKAVEALTLKVTEYHAHDGGAALTVDVVLFSVDYRGEDQVLLIQRGDDPFKGRWALPGGYVDQGEECPDAAARELREETGMKVSAGDLVHVGTYATVGRDPRGRVVSFAYMAVNSDPFLSMPRAGDDAAAAKWVPVTGLLVDPDQLAFDHGLILADAREHRCRATGAPGSS